MSRASSGASAGLCLRRACGGAGLAAHRLPRQVQPTQSNCTPPRAFYWRFGHGASLSQIQDVLLIHDHPSNRKMSRGSFSRERTWQPSRPEPRAISSLAAETSIKANSQCVASMSLSFVRPIARANERRLARHARPKNSPRTLIERMDRLRPDLTTRVRLAGSAARSCTPTLLHENLGQPGHRVDPARSSSYRSR